MPSDIPYEQLEAYLQDSLEASEKAAFEQRLLSDATLQKELALYRKVRQANQDAGLSALEEQLQSLHSRPAAQPGRRLYRRVWIPAALLLLALLFFLWYQNRPGIADDPAAIYAQYAQRDFAFREMSSSNQLAEIETRLNAGDYAAALPLLQTYLAEHPDAADVQLAQGVALLETGDATAAIGVFTDLGRQYPLYRTESLWQIALAHLKEGNIEDSTIALEAIPTDASRYDEARELLALLTNINAE